MFWKCKNVNIQNKSWKKSISRKLKNYTHRKSANCIIFTKRQFEIKTLSSKMLKKKKKKKKKIPEDIPGMFLLFVIEEISFQLGCFECKW